MKPLSEFFCRHAVGPEFVDQHSAGYLGSGQSRTVFALAGHPDHVLKHERKTGVFQNVLEWTLWRQIYFCERGARWLAPCEAISPCGTMLIQRRAEPIEDRLPERVPIWVTDMKAANWGWLDGRPVLTDYATTLLCNGAATRRLNAANWKEWES